MKQLKGVGASPGIAIAKAYCLTPPKFDLGTQKIDEQAKPAAHQAVADAFKVAIEQLEAIQKVAQTRMGAEHAAIFGAHIEVLKDPTLAPQIDELIDQQAMSAAAATAKIFEQTHDMFAAMDDRYFRERAADILDLKDRLLSILTGQTLPDLMAINEQVIIVAEDLAPSQTSLLDKRYVMGFITNIGGRTSHAAIIARNLGIPAVLGLKDVTQQVAAGDLLTIDGSKGLVGLQPTADDVREWQKARESYLTQQQQLQKYLAPKAVTTDGHEVIVAANIGAPVDMTDALVNGAKGVGLFRTEFLYMGKANWPTEEEQFAAYERVIKDAKGETVIIRTLDIGGDKTLPYYTFPHDLNPFLGYRAIRLCLDQQDIFKTQLRALVRASAAGPLGIMFPMIASIDELLQAKQILREVHDEVVKQGHKVGNYLVGIMVEIPAAAVLSEQFAQHVDFFSIGTNDLVQYSLAVDRMSESVSYLYQPLNPAVLRLIKMTIDGGKTNKVWTGMCGEMAGEPLAIPLLLGLGLHEFSMSAPSLLNAKRIISALSQKDCEVLARKALLCATQHEVETLVKQFMDERHLS